MMTRADDTIYVTKPVRRADAAKFNHRDLIGKAGGRDGLFAQDTDKPWLLCVWLATDFRGDRGRVVIGLQPISSLNLAFVYKTSGGLFGVCRVPVYQDAVAWRPLLGDDWEYADPPEPRGCDPGASGVTDG